MLPSPLEPIRAELYGPERLEQHAATLAGHRTLPEGARGGPLLPQIRDSGRALLQCYRAIAAVIREEGAITPAAEWFVDLVMIELDVMISRRISAPRQSTNIQYHSFPQEK